MKIRYLTSFAEARGPGIESGEVRDVDAPEAERLIAKGFAEAVASKPAASAAKGASKKAARAEKR